MFRDRVIFLFFLFISALAVWGCGDKPPGDWVAKVDSFTGKATASAKPGAQLGPVKKGQYLSVGARLETGPDGEALLSLRNGGKLTVKPNSVVLFRSEKPESELSLMLEQGSVLGTGSKVKASELLITVGQRKIRLGAEAKAKIVASGEEDGKPVVVVSYGNATVEGPSGAVETIVAGSAMVLTAPEPDAGAPPKPDAAVVVATPEVFYLRPVGRGRVMVKGPEDKRFKRVRRGKWIEVAPGTQIKLGRRAKIIFGPEKGKGTLFTGPGLMEVTEAAQGEPGAASHLKHLQGEIQLATQGEMGKEGSKFSIDGVTVVPRVTYKKADVRIRRMGPRRAIVAVEAGEARLITKDKKEVRLEAAMEATISAGRVSKPRLPPQAPFQVRHMGAVRVFINDPRMPVTFRWKGEEGAASHLVEVSRSPSFARPLFADVIKRNVLTVSKIRRGSLFWQVRPLDQNGVPGKPEKGRLVLLRDTSYRVLKNYHPPRNTIHERDGDTEVFYQNKPPRFTFRWNPMEGASKYTLKIFREQNPAKPLILVRTKRTSTRLKPGRLGEGTYLWYVAGRSTTGTLVRALQSRKLTVLYHNVNPDIQIYKPRNGLKVAEASIEVKGIAVPGSKVYVNGAEATMDKAYRFTAQVALKPGPNYIRFRVVAPRRGSSYYIRRVIR